MKLLIVSDLHLETIRTLPEEVVLDQLFHGYDLKEYVGVFAGDISTCANAPFFIDKFKNKFKDILFVPGNHDYWGTNIDQTTLNTHWVTEIDGIRFIGATGWAWNHSYDANDCIDFITCLADGDKILTDSEYGRFTWDKWVELAERDYRFIFDNIDSSKRNVIITHYAPSHKSTPEQFKDSPINCLFCSDYDAELGVTDGIDLWIHGHQHESCDYMIGNTRVVCNPMGYSFEGRRESYEPLEIEV